MAKTSSIEKSKLKPKFTVRGDEAEALGYSVVILREDDRWFLWRAAVNHWTLKRTDDGWRIVERFNRSLNGSSLLRTEAGLRPAST